MMHGIVKWFNDNKGYGFIIGDDGKEIFFHHSVIEADGFRSAKENDKVEFESTQTPKGIQATVVRKV